MSFLAQIAAHVDKVVSKVDDGIDQVGSKLEKGVKHARAEVIGRWNPNRRHDEPHEIAADEIRAKINASHRFNSFAEQRSQNFVKWHIDGLDYMWALSELLDNAKEAIFILDWWLTPELYLRRPPAYFPEWRLDRVLKRKAEQGVKIHVVVYKEVTQTMSMSSKHTKSALEALHPNISCMRHPDHIGAKDSIEFWSHHEKVVVVDNHYACVGGLDLCFGRWDTHTHPLADVHPTDFSLTLFPGQDYNNARVTDFKDVYNYASTTLSILDTGRMPWHDVHMTLTGPVVLDIVQHFVERWNEIKKRKYRDDARFPWLALPHDVDQAPNEAVAHHPHRDHWREVGHRYHQHWHRFAFNEDLPRNEISSGDSPGRGYPGPNAQWGCRVQVVRSVSDWSHGVLTEHSIQNAYIELIQQAEHFIYIENQFFISSTKENSVVTNLIGQAIAQRIIRAGQERTKFKVIVVIPEVPGFAGDLKDAGSIKTIMAAQYRTMNRGGSSIYEVVKNAGYEPTDYISFFHLRSYDRINAPQGTYIKEIERSSGVTFNQAEVALARQWIGQDPLSDQKTVTLTLPTVPTPEGVVVSDKTTVKTETVPIPESEEAARGIVEQFERGARGIRADEEVSDSVSQHMLNDRTGLMSEKWLGTEQEELDCYVSELLYIHTKLMIVDDRRVIMGSANLNDRSQKGDGDSEIALVVEDDDMIDSFMNGETYRASRFAASLRRKLFREHLGLISPQLCESRRPEVTSFMRPAPHQNDDESGDAYDDLIADPLSDATLSLWNDTARRNREIFTEIFRPIPSNLIRNWADYDRYVPKVKAGHVVPDIPLQVVKERLSRVKGTLIECPMDFLIDEKDFVTGPEWTKLNLTLPIYI